MQAKKKPNFVISLRESDRLFWEELCLLLLEYRSPGCWLAVIGSQRFTNGKAHAKPLGIAAEAWGAPKAQQAQNLFSAVGTARCAVRAAFSGVTKRLYRRIP